MSFSRVHSLSFLLSNSKLKYSSLIWRCCLLFAVSGYDTAVAQKVAYQLADSFRVINEARSHIEVLCSEDLHGRGYIENGHEKAAIYLAQVFAAYGLKGWQPDSMFPTNYFQPFSIQLNLIQNAEMSANGQRLRIGRDYIVDGTSAGGRGKAEVYDLGHGLPADFAAAKSKVKGKVLLVRAGLPPDATGTPDELKLWGTNEHKLKLAVEAKAAAVLLVVPRLMASYAEKHAGLPVFQLADSSFRRIQPRQLEFEVAAKGQLLKTQNVIGWIEGRIRDTALVFCGHYDHLGRQGTALFAGANDNASGTAFLLSLAEYYTQNKPSYSLVFIAFGAEETGLNGSMHYALKQPFWPLERTKAAINFDLMGNGQDGVMLVGGKTWPRWYQSFITLNDSLQCLPRIDARPNAPNSDHYPFTLKNVPGLFFYTLGGSIHYHDVHDLPNEIEMPFFFLFRELLIHWLEQLPEQKL